MGGICLLAFPYGFELGLNLSKNGYATTPKCSRKKEIRHQEKAWAIRGQCMMDGALIPPLSCGENNLENS